MLAIIFYTKNSSHENEAQHFAVELGRRKIETKLLEADSQEGIRLGELYDITARPAVALTRVDGTLVERWHQLPPAGDVSYLAHT